MPPLGHYKQHTGPDSFHRCGYWGIRPCPEGVPNPDNRMCQVQIPYLGSMVWINVNREDLL